MAPRATWKGFIVLARVVCPVRLHPALVRVERLGFQALNRATLNRLQSRPHDPQTGREVARDFIVRGYEVEPGQFVLVEDRDLAELQIESSRSLVLDRFILRASLDFAYIDTPYFIVPDGRGADRAFILIRRAMASQGLVGVSRIVLGSRERAAIIEPRGKGMLLVTLRAGPEVRGDEPYFNEIDDTPADAPMTALAERLVGRRAGSFDPRHDFRDRYQEALFHFVQARRRGEKPAVSPPPAPAAVIDLRAALEASVATDEPKPPAPSRRPSRRPTKRQNRQR